MFFKISIFAIFIKLMIVEGYGSFNMSPLMHLFEHPSRESEDFCRETNSDFTCKDCYTSIFCYRLPSGNWIWDVIRCGEEETCQRRSGKCDKEDNIECPDNAIAYEFVCYQRGLFPHPFDCRKYYLCTLDDNGIVKPQPVELGCKEGYAYDPLTTTCRKHIGNDDCPSIIESCVNIGASGPIVGNRQMYYTCLPVVVEGETQYFPRIFYCEDDQEFIQDICRDPVPPQPDLDNGICTETQIFADTDDCSKYHICINGDKPREMQCPPGERFDGWERKCIAIDCQSIMS